MKSVRARVKVRGKAPGKYGNRHSGKVKKGGVDIYIYIYIGRRRWGWAKGSIHVYQYFDIKKSF